MTSTGISPRSKDHGELYHAHLAPQPSRNAESASNFETSTFDFESDDDDDDEEDEGEEEEEDMRTPTNANHPNIPLHPIPSMQEAFAESLDEATKGGGPDQKPPLRVLDTRARRERLLDEDTSVGPPNRLWRFRPGQKCHELRKLMAQISFGVYLLINGMANSNAQVLSILQGHIDEVDEFLEMTMEDVKLGISDLQERLQCLQLPMENVEVFEQMLENRKFRLQIVEGNVKIEHILSRSSTAHSQTIRDMAEGVRSTKEFGNYLALNEHAPWRQDRPDVIDIYEAMKGNADGWHNAFSALEKEGKVLSGLLVRLSSLVVELDKKAGEISRRTRFTLEPYADTEGRQAPRSSESSTDVTPPPSPPMSTISQQPAPRIKTMYFGAPMTSLLEDPESPVYFGLPIRDEERPIKQPNETKDALPAFQYTPPETSRTIPEVRIAQEVTVEDSDDDLEDDAETGSIAEPDVRGSLEAEDDGNMLFVLQPRTYTPVPPAPIPSPRVSDEPRIPSEELRVRAETMKEKSRPTTAKRRDSDTLVEQPRPQTQPRAQPRHIEIPDSEMRRLQPMQTTSRDAQRNEPPVTSLRQRRSLKVDVPQPIRVPRVNPADFQNPQYPSPRASPRAYQTPDSAYGSDLDHRSANSRSHNNNNNNNNYQVDFSPPAFPNLIPSPSSDHQYFRPVQASPHSPLQQRPHTAGTVGARSNPNVQNRHAPSRMGMSMMTTDTAGTQNTGASTRTVKKKRSAFAWLKKAFSLDEEERAAFEQKKREQTRNLYYDERSPKFLDGKRVRRNPADGRSMRAPTVAGSYAGTVAGH